MGEAAAMAGPALAHLESDSGGRLILLMKRRFSTVLLKSESVRRAKKRYSCRQRRHTHWGMISVAGSTHSPSGRHRRGQRRTPQRMLLALSRQL
jgi:hypothetical protein